jgi:uncharacterized protein (TIGR02284 family)
MAIANQDPTMASSADHDIKTLNSLIECSIDSADGYAEAAKEAENTRYAALFHARAAERRHVVRTLQQQVRALGGEPEDDGTILGKAQRVCLDLRAKLSSHDDVAIVDEIERCEDHMKAKYGAVLKDTDLSPATRAVVDEAYIAIRSGHDQMRDLKHALHAK